MHMFGVRCILILAIFSFSESTYLVSSPVGDTDILKAESAIRNTANNLFYSLGLRKLQEISRVHQHALVHNYFITLTLQSYINQREITKLTRVDKGNKENGSDFIALLNEIQNEDNVLILQNMIMGDDTRTGYDLRSELEKLEYLKKYHEDHNNRSTEPNKDDLNIFQEEESFELDNITTPIGYNDSHDQISGVHKVLGQGRPYERNEDGDDALPERRIFGGKRTKKKSFPFMASVEIFGKFQCAGNVIKSDLVITAASCLQLAWNNRFYRENPAFLSVRVGSSFYEIGGDHIDVMEVYFYPTYNPKTLRHNLAIMRLIRQIKMEKRRVQKIKLSDSFGNNGGRVLVVGWGARSAANTLKSPWEDNLRYAEIDVYSQEDCQDIYSKEFVTNSNFCAGFISSGTGACNRDVGGPGVMSGKLAGVISFGAPVCGAPDNPTVFTKISFYMDWIEDIMEQEVVFTNKRTTLKPPTYPFRPPSHDNFDRYRVTPIVSKNPLEYNINGKSGEPDVDVTETSITKKRLRGKHKKHHVRGNSNSYKNKHEADKLLNIQQESIQIKEMMEEPIFETENQANLDTTTTPVPFSESENIKQYIPTVMDYKEKLEYDNIKSTESTHDRDQAKTGPAKHHKKAKKRKRNKKKHKPVLTGDPNNPSSETNKSSKASHIANDMAIKDQEEYKTAQLETMIKELENLTRAGKSTTDNHDTPLPFWELSSEDESKVFHNSLLQGFAHRARANVTLDNLNLPVEEFITKPANLKPTSTSPTQTVPQTNKAQFNFNQLQEVDPEFLLDPKDDEPVYDFMTESQEVVPPSNQDTLTQDQKEAILTYQGPIEPPQIEKSEYQELLAFQKHLTKTAEGVKLDNYGHSMQNNDRERITNQKEITSADESNTTNISPGNASNRNIPTQNKEQIKLAQKMYSTNVEIAKIANQYHPTQNEEIVELGNQNPPVQDEEFVNHYILLDNEEVVGVANQSIPKQAQDEVKHDDQEIYQLVNRPIPLRARETPGQENHPIPDQNEARLDAKDFATPDQETKTLDQQEPPAPEHGVTKILDQEYPTQIQEGAKAEHDESLNQSKEGIDLAHEKVTTEFSLNQQGSQFDHQEILAQVQDETKLINQKSENFANQESSTLQANPHEILTQNRAQALSDYQELLAYQEHLDQTIDPIETTEGSYSPYQERMTQTVKTVDQTLSTDAQVQAIARAYQTILKEAEKASKSISTTEVNEQDKNVLQKQGQKRPEPFDHFPIALEDTEMDHNPLTKSGRLQENPTEQEDYKSGKLLNQMEMDVKSFLQKKIDTAMHSLLASSSNQNASNIEPGSDMHEVLLRSMNENMNSAQLRAKLEDKNKNDGKIQPTKPQIHIFRNSVFKKKDISKLIALFKASSKIEHSFRSGKENETSLYDRYREFLRLYKDTLEGSDFENVSKEIMNDAIARRSMNIGDNETEALAYSGEDNTTEVSSKIGASEAAEIKRNVLDYINI